MRISDWSSDVCSSDLIAIWDPEKERTISKDTHHQNVDFNIFEGMTVRGVNTVTISQGKVVYQDGDIRTEKGAGRYVDRPTFPPYYQALNRQHEAKAPRSEEHTSELQSLMRISYAVFCLKKKQKLKTQPTEQHTQELQSQ